MSVQQVSQRFIPARAGNTFLDRRVRFLKPVHPRPRGEHSRHRQERRRSRASSPPARGTLEKFLVRTEAVRFIPARAGNTCSPNEDSKQSSVHPRPRGEHSETQISRTRTAGSSPPARGTLQVCDPLPPWIRFIPARAGNTLAQPSPEPFVPVHPRPRGEHWTPLALTVLYPGSSPPARGTHHTDAQLQRGPRFIPARAGNTVAVLLNADIVPVHPRPRGEHPTSTLVRSIGTGSSPPARGTLPTRLSETPVRRFIPARAGNTQAAARCLLGCPVHPRPRGEHCSHKILIQKLLLLT